jgi:oligopeptide transport system substrate-binding protein
MHGLRISLHRTVVHLIAAITLCGAISPLHADRAVDGEAQRIRIALPAEPPNLNSLVTTDQISGFVLSHVMEGLLRYDERGELAPGVAERWQLRDNGATFWLRRNARWSDGRPVTARDFLFAWRQVVSPATASPYASALFPIKNAERINRGELPSTALGVRAVGDYRLDVQFERPTPYFLGLTAFFSYYPVRADFYQKRGQRYAADAEDLLYNGAFTLTRWVHGARLTLTKNPNYWNRNAVRLNEIDIPYITADPGATLNLFKAGNIAMAQLDSETIGDALGNGYPIRQFSTGSLFYLLFNLREGRVTANHNLRKAIQAVFDPASLVNKVVGLPGNFATDSLFPRTVKGIDAPFRDEHPAQAPQRGLGLARHYLELAKRDLGVERMPPIVFLASDSARGSKEAEYFQQLLAAGLGLEVRIDKQIAKQRLDKMQRGDFDIAAAGWGPDYDDPMTFADLFASWNENNRGRYRSARYDELVQRANTTADAQERMALFAQMQQLLIDDVPLLPTYESGQVYLQHSQLRGVVRAIFGGDPNFRYAYVVEEPPVEEPAQPAARGRAK